MQLSRAILLLPLLGLLLCASPAAAGICTLTLGTGGALALSGDGTHLGSDQPGGIPAVITVASIGESTLTVSSPALIQYPAGFNPSALAFEVAYRGSGVLAGIDQPFTTSQTSIAIPNLISAVLLTIDNRITTASGLSAGTYQTRTVVTCS